MDLCLLIMNDPHCSTNLQVGTYVLGRYSHKEIIYYICSILTYLKYLLPRRKVEEETEKSKFQTNNI